MLTVNVKCQTKKEYAGLLRAFPEVARQTAANPSRVSVYNPNVEGTRKKLLPYFAEWVNMPEFVNGYSKPYVSVKLNLDESHYSALNALTKISHCLGHHFTWFPQKERVFSQYVHDSTTELLPPVPQYPVYIISLGRAVSRYTSKRLDEAGVPYFLVVEPSEYKIYAENVSTECLLRLPKDYSRENTGSIPARNFVWEHALNVVKSKRHWILDDNIEYFLRLNKNKKQKVVNVGAAFAAAEDFVDRYENIGLAGFHGSHCVKGDTPTKPFLLNSRVYSCILIRNDLPLRWRGRYNEDTDLSLRVLKSGLCTLLFNCFLFCKHTMRLRGGNTDGIYADGRKEFAESLARQHPDVAKVVKRFGRWHHMVNYKPFVNITLKRLCETKVPETINRINNYAMQLVVRKKM